MDFKENKVMKAAVLSNVNVSYIVKLLRRSVDVCSPEGYGDLWGQLLNQESSVSQYGPQVIILIIDISQLLDGWQDMPQAEKMIDEWFAMFEECRNDKQQYLISDVRFRELQIKDLDEMIYDRLEYYWKKKLHEKMELYCNTHRLPLCDVVEQTGIDSFYSSKAWYLGKMPYSQKGSTLLADAVLHSLRLMERVPKKVLVLDLDGTLWGGVLGEQGADGIQLSDEKTGAVYREAQAAIKKMQQRGVLLAVCSKNSRSDVQEVWDKHPHMVLREKDFAACYINWDDKAENMRKLSKELNLGVESFVFIDDMPAERENIRCQLPMAAVPEFPARIEEIPVFFQQIYLDYFKKMRATAEDRRKTCQYQENRERNVSREGMDYKAFLKSLGLRTERVDYDEKSKGRIVQLIGKTNQFNLTGRRYSIQELEEKIRNGWKVYAYRVSDKFGSYGIVAVLIVDLSVPIMDTFLMSCRVMGKQLENYFISQIEEELAGNGFCELWAEYVPGARNMPVKDLYEKLNYQIVEQNTERSIYKINLFNRPVREYYVTDLGGNDHERKDC